MRVTMSRDLMLQPLYQQMRQQTLHSERTAPLCFSYLPCSANATRSHATVPFRARFGKLKARKGEKFHHEAWCVWALSCETTTASRRLRNGIFRPIQICTFMYAAIALSRAAPVLEAAAQLALLLLSPLREPPPGTTRRLAGLKTTSMETIPCMLEGQ